IQLDIPLVLYLSFLSFLLISSIINCPENYSHIKHFNNERPHSGKYCYGKTPMQTFQDSKKLAVEKNNEILYLEYTSDSHKLSDIQI
ncbi:MAG: hypothetical protein ACRYE8_04045, partial [Janthinobacterium lividum]